MSASPYPHEGPLWKCNRCFKIFLSERAATNCCPPRLCGCGASIENGSWSDCDACHARAWRARQAEIEAERFEHAQKLKPSEWAGPVMTAGGKFYASVDALLDDLAPEEAPAYAWCCNSRPSFRVDIDSVIEAACENAHEDCETSDALGLEALEAAIDAFNALNAGDDADKTWTPRKDMCVMLAREDAPAGSSPPPPDPGTAR